MTASTRNIAGLSRERRELLELLLKEQRAAKSTFPLSYAQQRLWFLDQLEPGNVSYNVPLGVRLKGRLDVGALDRSLREVVRRHESLRTTFESRDGRPVQRVSPEVRLTLGLTDLSAMPEGERDAEAARLASEEARTPFDLEAGPLIRARLLRLSPEEHLALLTMHHIVSDGWSMGVLVREVAALYGAYAEGKESPLEELPIQYADYAQWQREVLSGEVLERQLAHWRERLAGAPSVLALPTDRPRPAMQTYVGAHEALVLDAELSAGIRGLGRRHGATLFMVLLAAFDALLSRYTGQEDLVVGTDVANRTRSELESLIGFFVNQLALRARVPGRATFEELLRGVRDATLDAYAHQEAPFERVVEAAGVEREVSHAPLFQVKLVLQNAPAPPLTLRGLTIEVLEVSSRTAKTDLALFVTDDRQLTLTAEYNTDLFDASTIARLLSHFRNLLAAAVADPSRTVADLPLLSDEEHTQLLFGWNDTARDYPAACLHELFEAQAARTPDAVALVSDREQLTYAELSERANRLAYHLRGLGAGPESLVGVLMERSPEMVVSLLAVLKAGGAYVPLDPSYPQERLRFMLEDARVKVLLTQERLSGLAEGAGVPGERVVTVDTERTLAEGGAAENPESGVTLDNLAYVIYTSGSTGRPKGAMNTHRAICNRLVWMQEEYRLTGRDRVFQKTPFSFDVSVWEFFWPLMTGARLVVAKPGGHQDSLYLVEVIKQNEITTLHFVPSMLQVFLEEPTAGGCDSLVRVICSGEALPYELQERFFERLGAELHNLYGPTEAAVDVTYWACERGGDRQVVPIGRPIANIQIYLLDRRMNPVPEGVAGELYIGGVGLARGYLNRPDLTAEKFVPNPFSEEPGARLYRTGDLARHLPDGNIKYLGRIDHQVKIRGLRIELGEIEAALGQHPYLQETVVVTVREDAPGDKRLVAYASPAGASAPGVRELRAYLKEKLPEYMIPSAFVMLEQLPLSPNGKVDRRALPAPEQTRGDLEEAFVAPRTPAEEILAAIWQEVLGVDRVGVNDNFFELGGDSILSLQVTARANQTGLRLVPAQMFQHQTVAGLAAVAGTSPALQAEQGLVTGEVPLTPIQRWFFKQEQPDPHHFNQAVLFEARRPVDSEAFKRALALVLAHHDALRLRFERDESGGWRQSNAGLADEVPLEEVDLSGLPAPERPEALTAAADRLQASLNLEAGPLVRAALFRVGEGEPARVGLFIHHLAVDGVSWRVLLEDLQTAYEQLGRGEEVRLPPKTTSYKHWAERLAGHAASDEVRAESAYWLDPARGEGCPLPRDFLGGENAVGSARTVSVSLGAEQTRALLQEVPAAYRVEINDLLLTALAQSLAGWVGGPFLVDLEGHGREQIADDVDVSRTVGWFTTIFPVLLDAGGAADPGAALKEVKERLRAVPRRGLGYGLLRYGGAGGGVAERLSREPQPEVAFNYLGQLDRVLPKDSLFGPARESAGETRSPRQSRGVLFEVNARVAGGRLHVDWSYSENVHRRATVESLAAGFVEALEALVSHCISSGDAGYTPSDFPQMHLNQEELDELMAELGYEMESEDEYEDFD